MLQTDVEDFADLAPAARARAAGRCCAPGDVLPQPLPARVLFEGRAAARASPRLERGARAGPPRELILAGGLDAGQCRRGDRRRAALRRRCVQRRRSAARASRARDDRRVSSAAARSSAAQGESLVIATSTRLDRERLLADDARRSLPDARGRFGPYGGRYIPETLVPAFERSSAASREHLPDAGIPGRTGDRAARLGRAAHGAHARRATSRSAGARRSGSSARTWRTPARTRSTTRWARRCWRSAGREARVAETGAGQHGVATAAACARLGLPCVVYMGEVDMERQAPNVGRMRLMGATVVPVTTGDRTLRAAIDEALRDWVSDPLDTYYCWARPSGRIPIPTWCANCSPSSGARRARRCSATPAHCRTAHRLRRRRLECDRHVPCLPRAMPVEIIGVEAGGRGAGLGDNAATLAHGRPACCMAATRCCCRTRTARCRRRIRCRPASTIRAWDPSTRCCATIGPRATTNQARDDEALAAVRGVQRQRRHPAGARKRACTRRARSSWARRNPGKRILVGLSGRGDKDMPTLQKTLLARDSDERAPRAASARRSAPRARARRPRAGRVPDGRLSDARAVPRAPAARSPQARTSWRSACRSPTRWPMA